MLSRKRTFVGLSVLGLGLLTTAALAGKRAAVEVRVEPGVKAYGSTAGARNSSDDKQFIGCSVTAKPDHATPIVLCHGRDSDDVDYACTSTNPAIIAAAQSITPDSFIAFHGPGDECGWLEVTNSSAYGPKAP